MKWSSGVSGTGLIALGVLMIGAFVAANTGCGNNAPPSQPVAASVASASYGLTIWPVTWEYPVGSGDMIHGIAAEGTSLHGTMSSEDPRPIKVLLMPMGWIKDGEPENPKLEFDTVVAQGALGQHVAIDLRHGAALIELGDVDAAVEQLLLKALAADSAALLPGVTQAKFDAMKEFVSRQAKFTPDPEWTFNLTELDPEQQEEAQEAIRTMAFGFWPMIYSRTVVAGSESTELLAVSLPRQGNTFTALVHVIDSLANKTFWSYSNTGNYVGISKGNSYRADGDDNSAIKTNLKQQDHDAVSYSRAALQEGWKTVFP